jgi:hypothetical protein
MKAKASDSVKIKNNMQYRYQQDEDMHIAVIIQLFLKKNQGAKEKCRKKPTLIYWKQVIYPVTNIINMVFSVCRET